MSSVHWCRHLRLWHTQHLVVLVESCVLTGREPVIESAVRFGVIQLLLRIVHLVVRTVMHVLIVRICVVGSGNRVSARVEAFTRCLQELHALVVPLNGVRPVVLVPGVSLVVLLLLGDVLQ